MKPITINGRTYNFINTTGRVEETSKNLETIVSGGGGGGSSYGGTGYTAPVRITSTTVVHDQIFLTDNKGTEHSFQLQGMNVACRQGNELTITSATLQGKNTLHYIAATNKTTGKVYFNVAKINRINWPPTMHLWICIAIGFFLMKGGSTGFVGALFFGSMIGILIFGAYAKFMGARNGRKFMSQFVSNNYE